ncbi:unnamed protein product [Choristocarpus tenellus]
MRRLCPKCITMKADGEKGGENNGHPVTPKASPLLVDEESERASKTSSSDREGSNVASSETAGKRQAKEQTKPCGSDKRARLSLKEKGEVLALLDQKVHQPKVAEKFGVGLRTIVRIKAERKKIEEQLSIGRGDEKAMRKSQYAKVDSVVLRYMQEAKKAALPVAGDKVKTVARRAKAVLLAKSRPKAQRDQVESFTASEKWLKNFLTRYNTKNILAHAETDTIDDEVISASLQEVRDLCKEYQLENIYSVDSAILLFKVMPRNTYVSSREDRCTMRGIKGMDAEDQVSAYLCANATGSDKVGLALIGKAVEPGCLQSKQCPCTYFCREKAWSDQDTLKMWFDIVFLPHVRSTSGKHVLLLVDSCACQGDLKDPKGKVTVKEFPPHCTSKQYPMSQGVIAAWKASYRMQLLDNRVSTMLLAQQLRDKHKLKIAPEMNGLAEGNGPHVLDAAELGCKAWENMAPQAIARCWLKAGVLHQSQQAELTDLVGQVEAFGMADTEEVHDLTALLQDLSVGVLKACRGKGIGDWGFEEDLKEAVNSLGIRAGEPPTHGTVSKALAWLQLEEQEEVATALKEDIMEELLEYIVGTTDNGGGLKGTGKLEDSKLQAGKGTKSEVTFPPPCYVDVAPLLFELEEKAAKGISASTLPGDCSLEVSRNVALALALARRLMAGVDCQPALWRHVITTSSRAVQFKKLQGVVCG